MWQEAGAEDMGEGGVAAMTAVAAAVAAATIAVGGTTVAAAVVATEEDVMIAVAVAVVMVEGVIATATSAAVTNRTHNPQPIQKSYSPSLFCNSEPARCSLFAIGRRARAGIK